MEKGTSLNPVYVWFEVWKKLNAAYCIDHNHSVSVQSSAPFHNEQSNDVKVSLGFPIPFALCCCFFLKAHRTKSMFSFLNHHGHNDEYKLTRIYFFICWCKQKKCFSHLLFLCLCFCKSHLYEGKSTISVVCVFTYWYIPVCIYTKYKSVLTFQCAI